MPLDILTDLWYNLYKIKDGGKEMFEIGSYVIYRAEGVCIVRDIRNESFGTIGKPEEYYILEPLSDRGSTVFVPVNNPKLVGYMRALMSAEEITAMLSELREERMEWITDSRARNDAFKKILALGDRRELVVLVNTVSERLERQSAEGKRAGTTDTNALHRAQKLLYEEFSATSDLASVAQVLPLLRGEITLLPKQR